MKINELTMFMNDPKNKMLKNDQLQSVLQKKLEVKEYMSIKDKKKLVEDIINSCILYEDGMYKFDDSDKYICFIMKSIEAYTNLELSHDIENDYDELCRAKVLEKVIGTFQQEYDDVNVLLQMKCDYILSGNTINAQVGRLVSALILKLDDAIAVFSKGAKNFDISKLPISKDDLHKLIDFLGTQK